MEFTIDEKLRILNAFIELHLPDIYDGDELTLNSDDLRFRTTVHLVHVEPDAGWIACSQGYIAKDSINANEAAFYLGRTWKTTAYLSSTKEEALDLWLSMHFKAIITPFSSEIPSFDEMNLELAIAGKDVKDRNI